MPLGKTARYYHSHPAARKVKAKKDAEINRRPDQVKKRVALNKFNRENHDRKGNKTDAIHKGKRIVGYAPQSRNRSDNNDTQGDRNARAAKRHGHRKR